MDKITTTIKREWLREIAAGRKQVEYREIKPYWTRRLSGIKTPFQLRLINGMQLDAPEITVLVERARKNSRGGDYELHLGKTINLRNWDRKREQPARDLISKAPVKKGIGLGKLNSLTDFCVYTIVEGKELRRLAKEGREVRREERKPWVTAEKLFHEARAAQKDLPVVFGDAAHCSRLMYWGLLKDVHVQDGATSFVVGGLREIRKRKTQELVLRSTRKQIAPNFIRPYSICLTPSFLNPRKKG
jgi:hypothetical protein